MKIPNRKFIAPLGSNLGLMPNGMRRKERLKFGGQYYSLAMVTQYANYLSGSSAEAQSITKAHQVARHLRGININARVVKWKNQSGIYIKPAKGQKIPTMTQLLTGKDRSNLAVHLLSKDKPVDYLDRRPWQRRRTRLPMRKANLIERPVVFNYTIKDKGTNTRSYSSDAPERPSMIVIGEHNIPMELANDYSSEYQTGTLDTEQRRGIDLMVSSLLDRPESDLGTTDGGFLLADGTGFGKTRQLLAVADQWRLAAIKSRGSLNSSNKSVMIVTENKETIEDSFSNDAKTLEIDLDDFDITTYTELGGPSNRAKELLNKKYGLVIYDEAHNMKNNLTPTAEKALSVNAEKAVFATATPLDTAPAGAYFLSRVTGIDEEIIQASLGLYEERGIGGIPYWTSSLSQKEINSRLAEYRRQLIENGLMMRRVHPFYGNVISSTVEMESGVQKEMEDIDRWWKQLRQTPSTRGQRALELARWEEAHKIPAIYENLRESLAEGKQVVVAVATTGDQAFKGLGSGRDEGTYKGTMRRIEQLNNRYGGESGLIPIRTVSKNEEKTETWHVGRKGAAHLLKEMLEKDGIGYSELTQFQKGSGEVKDFQKGKNKVMIMTPQSGGTGINLDDRTGDSPRHLIIGTKGWSGDKLEQLLGRVSRKTTLSPSLGEFVGLGGGWADNRQTEVLKGKLSALRSMTGSDIYGYETYEKEWKKTIERKAEKNQLSPVRLVAIAA